MMYTRNELMVIPSAPNGTSPSSTLPSDSSPASTLPLPSPATRTAIKMPMFSLASPKTVPPSGSTFA